MPSSTSTLPPGPVRWHAPTLVKASVAGHLVAVAVLVAAPSLWPWVLAVLVANHALIAGLGLWPRSTWLGSNMRRLPEPSARRGEVAVTIDDGPDPEVTPVVLDLLDQHGAKATFFCIAQQAQKHPTLCRQIVERGHSVQNHSHRHVHTFSVSGPKALSRELRSAQDALTQITGERPVFFRAPAGLRNLFLAPVMHEQGLQLVSWTRRGFDTVRSDPADVLSRLTRHLAAGDILLMHDAHCRTAPSGKPVVLEVLPELLAQIRRAGLRTVTLPQAMREEPAA